MDEEREGAELSQLKRLGRILFREVDSHWDLESLSPMD